MNNELINEKFKQLFIEHRLDVKRASFLLAVSGGLDSICMLDLFIKNNLKFSTCHCNFNLRGSDSLEDLKFVKKISKVNGISFYSKNFDVTKDSINNKISVQLSARNLRYKWFGELINKKKIDFLCTAHHLNDNLETVLYNITKSTGYKGVRGIRILRDKIFRPLMNFTKNDLEAYATSNNLIWREDTSNSLTKYNRNSIRLNVVPHLKKINPSLENSIHDTSIRFSAFEKFIKFSLSNVVKRCVNSSDDELKIKINLWEKKDKNFFLFKEYIIGFGFNYDQSKNIINSLKGTPGKVFESKDYKLFVDRKSIFLLPKKEEKNFNIKVDKKGFYKFYKKKIQFDIIDYLKFSLVKSANIAQLDFEKLHFPLEIRKWKHGDHFIPFGLNGTKKISDFLVDRKVSRHLKISQSVVLCDNKIIWLIGHQIDDNYKITDKTKKILQISVN